MRVNFRLISGFLIGLLLLSKIVIAQDITEITVYGYY